MALTDELARSALEVDRVRGHVEVLREALDRTDAILGSAEEGIERLEDAVVTTKRWAPRVAIVVAAVAVAAVAFVVIRRSRLKQPTEQPEP